MLANALIGTVLSDYLWSLTVFYTSALVASLGTALTVPLSLVVDIARGKKQLTVLYGFGVLTVVLGFIASNVG